jgi:VIT1/CCC1 family predicted Fe2+/Mn2+ transporter
MKSIYVRNIIFGISDSLVSTVGLLAGIDVSGSSHSTIILTGLVYAFVESFSMAVGSFLSEEATEEFETGADSASRIPILGGAAMFVSFLFSSFIPLLPYVLTQSAYALWGSIILSLVTLFVVGIITARVSKVRLLRHAVKMVVLGGVAIIMGALVGAFVHVQ